MNNRRKYILLSVLALFIFIALVLQVPQVTQTLDERLVSSSDQIRFMAMIQLSKLSSDEKTSLVLPLVTHVNSDNPFQRRMALYTLRGIQNVSDETRQVFLKSLFDQDRKVRREAISGVLAIGAEGIEDVVSVLPRVDREVYDRLTQNMIQMGESVVAPVSRAAEDKDPLVRREAVRLLWKMEGDAIQAQSKLHEKLNDADSSVRTISALALFWLTKNEKLLTPIFSKAILEKEWNWIQYETLKAINQTNKPNKQMVSILLKAIVYQQDGYAAGPYGKPAIAETLGVVDPRPTGIKALEWDLKHKRMIVRYRAAWRISQMKPPDRRLAASLVRGLEDEEPIIVARCVDALNKIGLKNVKRFHDKIGPAYKAFYRNARFKGVEGMDALVQDGLTQLNLPVPQ